MKQRQYFSNVHLLGLKKYLKMGSSSIRYNTVSHISHMSPDCDNHLETEIQVTHWSLYFLVDFNDKIDLKGILGQVYCPIVTLQWFRLVIS